MYYNIDYLFGDNIWDFLCVFLYGVWVFTVVIKGLLTYLCTTLSNNISNYPLIIVSHYLGFSYIIWDLLGRISGSISVCIFVSYYVSLYFSLILGGCTFV